MKYHVPVNCASPGQLQPPSSVRHCSDNQDRNAARKSWAGQHRTSCAAARCYWIAPSYAARGSADTLSCAAVRLLRWHGSALLCQRRAARIIASTQRQRNAGNEWVKLTVAASLTSSSVQDPRSPNSAYFQSAAATPDPCATSSTCPVRHPSRNQTCPAHRPTGRPRWMRAML